MFCCAGQNRPPRSRPTPQHAAQGVLHTSHEHASAWHTPSTVASTDARATQSPAQSSHQHAHSEHRQRADTQQDQHSHENGHVDHSPRHIQGQQQPPPTSPFVQLNGGTHGEMRQQNGRLPLNNLYDEQLDASSMLAQAVSAGLPALTVVEQTGAAAQAPEIQSILAQLPRDQAAQSPQPAMTVVVPNGGLSDNSGMSGQGAYAICW